MMPKTDCNDFSRLAITLLSRNHNQYNNLSRWILPLYRLALHLPHFQESLVLDLLVRKRGKRMWSSLLESK